EDAEDELAPFYDETLAAAAAASAKDEAGIEHALWVVREPRLVAAAARFLAPRPGVIADGHHRYATALNYRAGRRAEAGAEAARAPYERALGYFATAYGAGTLLLPIHRVVRRVPAPTDAAWRERLPGWSETHVALGPGGAPAALDRALAPLADR